ncbi:MAG: thiolase family protein [archaeon]|nr:thiolase family protein [archaeon]
MTKDVVIVSACRTPIGAMGGSLQPVAGYKLASTVMREAIKRANIDGNEIQDVRFGCCLEDVDSLNIARVAALDAEVPIKVPAVTINRVCISGMEATLSGVWQIQAGITDVVLVGGVEAMSRVPYVLPEPGTRFGSYKLQDKVLIDALNHGLQCGSVYQPLPKGVLEGPLADPAVSKYFEGKPYIMGLTAEFIASKWGISREEQDEVACRSHNNAEKATVNGNFKDEIVPVTYKDRRKGEIVVDKDEHFRPGMTIEKLASLRPVFIPKNGTVTAGNASGINDGASAMIIMSAEKAEQLGVKPLAKISGMGMGACEPWIMGASPVPAVKDLLKRTGDKLDDYERIEVNEAFAAQYICCERDLELNREITNVHGSGIGLGHPVGCTGNRIMVTLLHELIHTGKSKGMATLCGGGGVSMACTIDKL